VDVDHPEARMELQLPKQGDPLTVILKLAGDACNINCYYCYEKRKPGSDTRWLDAATLERFLVAARSRPLRVVLHGGEPLLIGQSQMRSLLCTLAAYDGTLDLVMQTNAMLLSDAWMDLFDEWFPDLDIGVSIDGPREGNAFRVDFRDRPTFDRVVAGLAVLERRGKLVALRVTVTRLLLGRERETLNQVATFPHVGAVWLSPCLDYDVTTRMFPVRNAPMLRLLNGTGRGAAGWSTSPREYTRFLATSFDVWRESYVRRFLVEPLFSMLLALTGGESRLTDWSAHKEPFIVTLYPDGRITGSDEFSNVDVHLGTVDKVTNLDDVLGPDGNPTLHDAMRAQLAACAGCPAEAVCAGGSLPDRLRLATTPWYDEYCDARRWLVHRVAAML